MKCVHVEHFFLANMDLWRKCATFQADEATPQRRKRDPGGLMPLALKARHQCETRPLVLFLK